MVFLGRQNMLGKFVVQADGALDATRLDEKPGRGTGTCRNPGSVGHVMT